VRSEERRVSERGGGESKRHPVTWGVFEEYQNTTASSTLTALPPRLFARTSTIDTSHTLFSFVTAT
jgi:hypothetical protein